MLLRSNLVFIFIVITISLLCEHAQGKRGRYRYNHPPSIESTDNVPVAVVYDSEDIRENKAIKLSANFQTTTDDSITPEKNIKQDANVTSKINTDLPKQTDKVEPKTIKSDSSPTYNERNLQIPVSVVYDSKPSYKENVQSTSAPIVRRRPTGRRLPKSEAYKKPTDDVAIDNKNQSVEKNVVDTSILPNPTPNTKKPLNPPVKDQSQIRIVKRKRTRDPVVPIVTERNVVYSHSGNFHYSFEGGDGTKVFEDGLLKSINDETGEAVSGGFSYKDKDGNDISLSYTADENGYRPIGAHLPTSPPIPPEIARALAHLATKTTPQPVTEPTRKFD